MAKMRIVSFFLTTRFHCVSSLEQVTYEVCHAEYRPWKPFVLFVIADSKAYPSAKCPNSNITLLKIAHTFLLLLCILSKFCTISLANFRDCFELGKNSLVQLSSRIILFSLALGRITIVFIVTIFHYLKSNIIVTDSH